MDLVFFHGFVGCKEDWIKIIELLRPSQPPAVRFLALDLPGHGQAECVSGWAELIACLRQTLSDLNVQKPLIVGYSLGGRIALKLAQSGFDVKGLVLESVALGLSDPEARRLRKISDMKLLEPVLNTTQSWPQFLDSWYTMPLFQGLKKEYGYLSLLGRRLRQNPQKMYQVLKELGAGSHEPLDLFLKQSDIPVTYIYGEDDKKYSALATEYRRFKNAEVVAIRGASHNTHFQKPQAFAKIILRALLL